MSEDINAVSLGSVHAEPDMPPGEPAPARVADSLGANSRSEALAAGLLIYFSGPPCPRNHGVGRYTRSDKCPQCVRELRFRTNRIHPSWPQAEDDYLKANWGTVSASVIGAALGRTRSAVIGRAHRTGLAEPYKRDRRSKELSQSARNARRRFLRANPDAPRLTAHLAPANMTARVNSGKPARKPPKPHEWVDLIEPATDKAVSLWDLTNTTCRWPVTTDEFLQMYCGDPSADLAAGCPYCPYHLGKAYQKDAPVKGHSRFIAQPWSLQERRPA